MIIEHRFLTYVFFLLVLINMIKLVKNKIKMQIFSSFYFKILKNY